jgi:hypothetical protein
MPLTENDRLILGALFDSETSPSNVAKISIGVPSYHGIPEFELTALQQREAEDILPLNEETPSTRQIESAIAELTALSNENPKYASAYNNRAQAVRLLVDDDVLDPKVSESSIYKDLCTAIKLASPKDGNPTVSLLQTKILAPAHTHRATMLLKCSRHLADAEKGRKPLPEQLEGLDSQALERMAGRDFQAGGRYGNAIAKANGCATQSLRKDVWRDCQRSVIA